MGKEQKKRSGFLQGCLIIVGICVVSIIVIIIVIVSNRETIMTNLLDQTKVGMSALLTEDHTGQEQNQFLDVFERLVEDMKIEGLQQGVQKNKDIIVELQKIIEDKRINRAESAHWVEEYMKGKK
ncbi:MAG: hypothetical protein KKH94_05610 [Candidatus Omnitrophica bacterium]|nr:hypothetical protein [Candidatus Omnitrophota bacterium]